MFDGEKNIPLSCLSDRDNGGVTTSGSLSVAVVGPGAIGTTIAAALQQVGPAPQMFGRTARDRLTLDMAGERVVVPGPVRVDAAAGVTPVDLVFLAVKSTQVEAAGPWLSALCRAGTVICVLQNGVEQEATTTMASAAKSCHTEMSKHCDAVCATMSPGARSRSRTFAAR